MEKYTIKGLVDIVEREFPLYDTVEVVTVLRMIEKNGYKDRTLKEKESVWKKLWTWSKSYQRQKD